MTLPAEFIERTRKLLGEDDWKFLAESLQEEPLVSVRVNKRKCASLPTDSTVVPWCADGYYLSSRPSFTFDPLFHAGCYYVQEASSMFLDRILRQYVTAPSVMLDLCAAPGGKSTVACAALPEGSLLVTNEIIRNRSQILAENMVKWGYPDVVVTNNAPEDFACLGQIFDVVLADVPCSGEGMFRKDGTAVSEWSVGNVSLCWQRQRRIVGDVWPCLKDGGIMIYSTCTYNREENEDNVAWIAGELGAEVLSVDINPEWNIMGNLSGGGFPVYRFFPHKVPGEGLFMAVLRKVSGESDVEALSVAPDKRRANRAGRGNSSPKISDGLKEWILHPDRYTLTADGTSLRAFPSEFDALHSRLKRSLKVLHSGITLGEWKGGDWQPDHSLAMSTDCNRERFPQVELDYGQAVSYLRKESVLLPAGIPKGYVIVTYRGYPLGFVKNVGSRANNLYPQEWRIRSSYRPDDAASVLT